MPTQCILFLAANPSDQTRLGLDRELREIREELERSKMRDAFDLQSRGAVRPKDFGRSLLDLKPTYLHFSGHGSSAGAILVEDESGAAHRIQPEALASLFKASGKSVECVLLNACFSKDQAHAISAHVPYVIGMNIAISDEAATAFARGFYRGIGAGTDISGAFQLGLAELKIYNIPEAETPILIERKSPG